MRSIRAGEPLNEARQVAESTLNASIRMALGADTRAVLRMVMSEGGRLIAVGLGCGLVATYWLMQFLQKQLFGVNPHDPVVALVAVFVLGGVALFACWLPARRAAKVDPMVALRAE